MPQADAALEVADAQLDGGVVVPVGEQVGLGAEQAGAANADCDSSFVSTLQDSGLSWRLIHALRVGTVRRALSRLAGIGHGSFGSVHRRVEHTAKSAGTTARPRWFVPSTRD